MRFVLTILVCIVHSNLRSQNTDNKYGLYIITSIDTLQQTITADSNKAFVRIKDHIPDIVLDIKYATVQNVFYEKLYDNPYAIIRLPVAKALKQVHEELKRQGIGLKIYDAYRPYSVTCRMWDIMPDSIYMGKPWRGSKHNRGISVDLTLIDFKTKKELRMPTPYDALVYPSHPDFMQLPDSAIRNRQLLITTMHKYGFSVAKNEWWHFDFIHGLAYELVDISHKQVLKIIRKGKGKRQ